MYIPDSFHTLIPVVGCPVAIHRDLPNTAAPADHRRGLDTAAPAGAAANHMRESDTAAPAGSPAVCRLAVCMTAQASALPLPSAHKTDQNISPAEAEEVHMPEEEAEACTQAVCMPVPVAAGAEARKQAVGAPHPAVRHIRSKSVRHHRVVHYIWSNSLLSTFPYSGINVNAAREAKNRSGVLAYRQFPHN